MKKVLLYGLLFAALSVHAQELLPYPTDTVDGKVYYRYTVEKSIGLYRISKNFGVSQEAILQANPELKERGLKFEEVILIPANLPAVQEQMEAEVRTKPLTRREERARQNEVRMATAEVAEKTAVVEPVPAAVVAAVVAAEGQDSTAEQDAIAAVDTVAAVHYSDTVRLTYLLPLQAELAQRNPSIDRFYDFYAGSLLALKHHDGTYVDSLGQVHTTYYDVHTFDIGKDTRTLIQLMDSGALLQSDAILGPAFYQQVKAVSAYALAHQIPVMVPFLQSVPDITTNPYLLKFNAYEDIQNHALMEYLDSVRSSINMVLVDAYASAKDYPSGIRKLRDSIAARGLSTTHTTIRHILADSISAALKDSVENILLFHSERYSNVQLLMPYLLSGKRGKQLTILGEYAWQSEHLLLPLLTTSVFRTPSGEAAERYKQDFAQYFGHPLSSTQPRYDLLGYDLTRYVLEALRGGTFRVSDTVYDGIQSSLLFKQVNENGGFENTYIIVNKR